MKKLILLLGVVGGLLLAGCNQGGTSDQYNTSSGASNAPSQNAPHGTNAP